MHEEHRQRLKNRFLKEGLDNFEPHNALELLLFFSIPQKDVNETAHELINRFGSFSKVLDADFDELITVPGIKEHSATLIKLIPSLARYYANDQSKPGLILNTLDKVGNYLVNKYIGATVETVYLLMLDNKFSLIGCEKMFEGSVNSAHLDYSPLVQKAVGKKASMVVLSHNHPGGVPYPSSDDKNTTMNVELAFDMFGIKLLDHVVVAGKRFLPVLGNKNLLRTDIPDSFYEGYSEVSYK